MFPRLGTVTSNNPCDFDDAFNTNRAGRKSQRVRISSVLPRLAKTRVVTFVRLKASASQSKQLTHDSSRLSISTQFGFRIPLGYSCLRSRSLLWRDFSEDFSNSCMTRRLIHSEIIFHEWYPFLLPLSPLPFTPDQLAPSPPITWLNNFRAEKTKVVFSQTSGTRNRGERWQK